jgi:hypothetical protein
METKEYLESVLSAQNLADDSAELKDLQARRAAVEQLIRDKYGSVPTIRYGGSKAKGTLIKESYDLDIVCYLPCDSNAAGDTLEDIYKSIRDCLAESYYVEEKTSALRIRSKEVTDYRRDFHIDVVPGRFTDEKKADCFIYQNGAEKCRRKTNLTVHIEHIRDSGVVDAIRLLKLWKTRRTIRTRQFAFELMIVKLLEGKKSKPLAEQLTDVWTEIKDSSGPIKVEDPANPNGNDLSGIVGDSWTVLCSAATSTLESIKQVGWETVFGAVSKVSGVSTAERAYRAAIAVNVPNRPWCDNA